MDLIPWRALEELDIVTLPGEDGGCFTVDDVFRGYGSLVAREAAITDLGGERIQVRVAAHE